MDNRAPREREGAFGNIHPRATKSHSWNIAKKPPTHRSVGRYRQGIIGYNCPCVSYGITHRHKTAHTPLQRHYASKGNSPIYRTVNRLELFIRLLTLLCSPVDRVQSRLARLASHIPSTPLQTAWGSLQTPQEPKTKHHATPQSVI